MPAEAPSGRAPRGRRRAPSTLQSRNVTLRGRRTSLRLEAPMWEALEEIARREGLGIGELCAMVDRQRRESTLTAAIRVFILHYFRQAATEPGHGNAGHGRLDTPRVRQAYPRRGTGS